MTMESFSTRYSSRIAPIKDALARLAGCKAYKKQTVPNFTDLVLSKKPAGKKWLQFELICALEIGTLIDTLY